MKTKIRILPPANRRPESGWLPKFFRLPIPSLLLVEIEKLHFMGVCRVESSFGCFFECYNHHHSRQEECACVCASVVCLLDQVGLCVSCELHRNVFSRFSAWWRKRKALCGSSVVYNILYSTSRPKSNRARRTTRWHGDVVAARFFRRGVSKHKLFHTTAIILSQRLYEVKGGKRLSKHYILFVNI